MNGLFDSNGNTTTEKILIARNFFATNPTATIPSGIWTQPTMSKEDFYTWFRKCLRFKTGGEPLTHRDHILMRDCRIIKDYLVNRIRHSGGRNLLSTPKLKRMYPQIDNQMCLD